ncbi:MAG TPA: twin-arginine translocase subunit TatC [Gaiellaceae bacterium]|nr:twin-arginine translocase subunit TatC [Gaiellaceae bacterium]
MPRLPRRLAHAEEATLGEHLEELRQRLFVIIGALVLGTIVAYVFHNRVLDWLNGPLPAGRRLVTLGVAEPFTTTLMVCVYAGLVLSLPIVLWQLWSFFAPAVDPSAERRILLLVASSVVLGAAGVAFGYEILLPRAIHFLTNYDKQHFNNLIQAKPYYNFVITILLGIVVVFQTPLAILGLVSLGVLTSRTLRRQRRIGYFITAGVALALPGPDLVTTFLELLPMWALFEGSIWLAVLFERRQAKAAPASATLGG